MQISVKNGELVVGHDITIEPGASLATPHPPFAAFSRPDGLRVYYQVGLLIVEHQGRETITLRPEAQPA